jgi:hypothetical protein
MIRHIRLSPSMGVALVALVVALGGTGIAAVALLPPNSVGTAQIRDDSITRAKIAHESITSVLVKDGSLLASDFAAGQLPAGPAGPAGPQGPKGDAGTVGDVTVHTQSVVVPGSLKANDGVWETRSVTLYCPAGTVPLGAGTGWSSASGTDALATVYMRPTFDAARKVNGYHARGGNDTGTPRTFTLYVLCAKR